MPTIITHAVVGFAGAGTIDIRKNGVKICILSILCAIAPDADVITFKLGISYSDFLGHRGFFHSIFAGICLGFLVTTVFFRSRRLFSREWWLLSLYFSLITCSHGILDAFTNGGLGIALLAPFDNTRYFFWTTPIEVVSLNPAKFFSAYGVRILSSEILLIWLPAAALVVVIKLLRHISRNS